MKILGIETSCDETAAAVIQDGTKILSSVVASSADMHVKTGGIVPENAARQQVVSIIPVLKEVLEKHDKSEIDAVAVSIGGPGLIGSLLVGVETAKTLSFIWKKPIVPVVHILAHLYANWLYSESLPQFPAIVLTVAGGHTDLFLMRGHGDFKWLGGTRDDAAGEAFDKCARLLGLPYPGGPSIEKAAKHGDPSKIVLPKPLIGSDDYDFSFSGLKTAVLREVQKNKKINVEDMAASVEEAITQVLAKKTLDAAKKHQVKSILVAGGVAANSKLRQRLLENTNTPLFIPPINLCTDNGTYIASYAFFNYHPTHWSKISPEPDPFEAIKKYASY